MKLTEVAWKSLNVDEELDLPSVSVARV